MSTMRREVLHNQSQIDLCRTCPIALDTNKYRHYGRGWRFKLSNLALSLNNGGLRWLAQETVEQLWFGLLRLRGRQQLLTVREQARWGQGAREQ